MRILSRLTTNDNSDMTEHSVLEHMTSVVDLDVHSKYLVYEKLTPNYRIP